MNSNRIHNACQDWLGIDSPTMPTHYELLGIPMFESSAQAIVAAYGARTAQISRHLSGPNADVASQVLSALAAAQACLLDAQAKANYDAQLPTQALAQPLPANSAGYHRPAPRDEAGIASAAMPVAASAVAAPAAQGHTSPAGAPPQQFKQPRAPGGRIDEPMSALPWLIGGVCAGLLGVCVLAMVLFGTRDRNNLAEVESEHAGGPNAVARDTRPSSGDRPRGVASVNARAGTATSDEQVSPPATAANRLTWDREPVPADGDVLDVGAIEDSADSSASGDPSVDPEPAAPVAEPVLRLAEVPRAVALPRSNPDGIASIAPAVLTRVNVADVSAVRLQLPSGQPAGGSGRFKLTPRDASGASSKTWDVQHVADGADATTVGQYTLADGELMFAWSPDADPLAKQRLENQPLQIIAGDEVATIAQREPKQAEPIVVKVDAGAIGATVSIDHPPENAELVVAIDDLSEEFGEYAWEPSNSVGVGKSTTLRFGAEEDAFQLALQVSAEGAGPNRYRIEARPMFRSSGTMRWDYFRPKQAAEALVALQQQQGLLDAQMQEIQRRFRRDPAARDQATALHNQQSAVLLERIANLERISARCLELQDKAELHFRIYADTGEGEIELLSTQPKASRSPAAKKQDVPENRDANIGAPIEPEVDPPAAPTGDPAPAVP